MNPFLESLYANPDLEKLKSVMDFHFGQYFKEFGLSLEDQLLLNACAVMEYLVYFKGNAWRLREIFHYRYPQTIREILDRKFHDESERYESMKQRATESELEVVRLKEAKWKADQKVIALTRENERLQKMIDKQNQIMRNLQDRLDGVNNSGQQIG
jgi:hypothetical protein